MPTRDEVAIQVRERWRSGKAIDSALGEIKVDGAPLGEGGTAVVYPVLFGGAPAAAKFLVELGSSQRQRRFQYEYQKLVRIRHRNIIALYHYEEAEIVPGLAVPMIVMERCKGSLKQKIATSASAHDRLSLVNKLNRQLLPAIEELHRAGIIHRDLKPENIFYRADGSLVLADFGIAKFDPVHHPDAGNLTRANERLGNRAYSSPEQETGGPLAPTADIFAFGQLVHAAIFGQPLRGSRARRASEVDRSLSLWDELLPRMLDMDPAKRPQTVEELRVKLDELDTARRRVAEAVDGVEALRVFEEVVAEIAPGSRGLLKIEDPTEIERAMNVVANRFSELDLWWTQGRREGVTSDNVVRQPPRRLEDGSWLVGHVEMQPESLWVYQPGYGLSRQFIAMVNKPRPGFFGEPGGALPERSEAGFYDGRYVSRAEYDDGFARIDGEVVNVGRAALRVRDHRPRCYVLVSRLNVLLGGDPDRTVGPDCAGRLAAALEADEQLAKEECDQIHRLPRRAEVAMLD